MFSTGTSCVLAFQSKTVCVLQKQGTIPYLLIMKVLSGIWKFEEYKGKFQSNAQDKHVACIPPPPPRPRDPERDGKHA